jgi:hypothetical protein
MLLIYTRQEIILDSIGRIELNNNSLEKKFMEIIATVYKTDIHCFEFDVYLKQNLKLHVR